MMTWPINSQSRIENRYPDATSSLTSVIIDPGFIGIPDEYTEAVTALRNNVHAMKPLPGLNRSLLPGEIEAERETDFKKNGIPLYHQHVQSLRTLGNELDLPSWGELTG